MKKNIKEFSDDDGTLMTGKTSITPEELEQRIKNSEIEKRGNLKFYRYKNKYYQSDDNGNLLKDKHWNYVKYDELYNFNEGFVRCYIKDKGWNWINENGEIFLPNQWFDLVYDFYDGFARCKINFKWNWINKKGEIISPNLWFDYVYNFNDGIVRCYINNKGWNWINEKGNLVSPNQWFDGVEDFKNGFARCKIYNKGYNWVNENGEIISPNQWFDDAYNFNDGFSICKIGDKWCKIDTNGNIINKELSEQITKMKKMIKY